MSPFQFRIVFMLILLSFTAGLFAQDAGIIEFHEHSLQTRKQAMVVLGSWAAGNIILGASMMPSRKGADRYFHQMNAMWNAVNLGIAALGYWQASKDFSADLTAFHVAKDHFNIQKVLLLNAGLDVGYIVGGLYMKERARRGGQNSDRLTGWGNSVMLQGGFLLVFDVVTAIVLSKQNPELQTLLGAIRFTGSEIGLAFQF